MKLQLSIKQTWHFECPSCKKLDAFEVSHLLKDVREDFGPWYCDNCGIGVKGKVSGGAVAVELSGTRREDTVDLLRLPPQADPLYLVVKGFNIVDTATNEVKGCSKEYWYEAHNCPVNVLSHTEAILTGNDSDPHGIFEYLGSSKITDPEFDGADFSVEDWCTIFPQLRK